MLSKATCEIAYEFSGARIGYKRNKIPLAGIVAIQWSRILLASFYVAVIAHRLQRDHPERCSVSLEQLTDGQLETQKRGQKTRGILGIVLVVGVALSPSPLCIDQLFDIRDDQDAALDGF